ncbi:MAG: carbohydrate ABC transporter permease [Candidatus Bipolaricaulia bacterium]
MRSTRLGDVISWIGVILVTVFVLSPILWGLRTSLAPRFDKGIIPSDITVEHYQLILARPEFFIYTKNSLLVAAGAIAITLPVALLGGYALARFNFPGKNLSVLLLILPLLPAIAILIPLISYVNKLGLYNTHAVVIMANAVFNLPFAIWMLRNFILINPIEIEEAAMIDGCSRIRVLYRIAIPMMTPGLIAVAVFVFITSWNNYLYAFALTASPDLRVLPQGILSFIGVWGTNYGGLTAIGTLALIPPVALFLLFQRWFIAGVFGQQLK